MNIWIFQKLKLWYCFEEDKEQSASLSPWGPVGLWSMASVLSVGLCVMAASN